jgi:acyl carrier protein
MSTEIEDEIRAFIVDELFEQEERSDLSPDDPLLSGLLDSWALLQLLNFLEERYDISISHNEVVEDNFGTIRHVREFVRSKLDAEESPAQP